MNYLELCQRMREEAGISGGASLPASVLNQTGEMKRVVNWVRDAYEFVQNKHEDWEFLRTDFSFPTTLGVSTYTPASVTPALSEHARWKTDSFRYYNTVTGVSSEQYMIFVPWDIFRDAFLFGSIAATQGPPTHFTVKPDQSIVVWGVPNDGFTIRGEYWKRAQAMTANGDSPLFPVQFHLVLVWKALMSYGAFEGAPEVYANGEQEFKRLMGKLENDQRPEIGMPGPLA